MSAAFSDLLAIRRSLADQVALESAIKQRIQQRMGDATKALFDAGEVSWKRSKDGAGLHVEKLLKAHPELLQSFPLVKPGSRRFLVNG